MILVDLERVAVRRPDRPLFKDLSLTLSSEDRLGIVGRNGAGKSTLLRLMAGVDQAEEGAVRRGREVRIGFLAQRPQLSPGSVRSAVGQHWEASAILDRLGMIPVAEADVSMLSGGQAKRVALARVLVDEVDLLILDEPTNHLDLDSISWLEQRLAQRRGGLVVVSHDRWFLDRVTTTILELDRGRGYVHESGYSSYLAATAARHASEAQAETVRRNLARTELAWLRRGAPARSRKPKARIASATAIVEGGAPSPDRAGNLDLANGGRWGSTPRLGDQVFELVGVGHRYNATAIAAGVAGAPAAAGVAGAPAAAGVEGTGAAVAGGGQGPALFSGVDLDIGPGERLGVVGPNGSGKSTLLDVIAGRLVPTAGRVKAGPTVRLGYYDQTGRKLDPTLRVRQAVAGSEGQPTWEQAALMERFWFDADAQHARIGTLSGGEQRRLQLLLVLAALPNVLLLDEPSNDLDLDTLRALEDFLDTWPGTAVVASHDRAFLGRTVEDVLVLDGSGGAALARRGCAGYLEDLAARAASDGRRVRVPAVGLLAAAPGSKPAGGGQLVDAMKPSNRVSKAASSAKPASATKVRSSSTLRRLISLAEQEVAKAEEERDRLVAELSDGTRDYVEREKLAHSLADVETRLTVAEDRWLELSGELGV